IDGELSLTLGSGQSTQKHPSTATRYRLRKKLDGGYRLHVGSSEIDFRRNNRDPVRDDDQPRFRDFDADSNQYLDEQELMNVPASPQFALVDSDSDGKVTRSEFEVFIHRRTRVSGVQLVLEVTDQGSDLFTALDRNFDRVLTPRELHLAQSLLATED